MKFQLNRADAPWEYPSLGFTATTATAILDGSLSTPPITVPPDAYWSVYVGGSAETGITRFANPVGPDPATETPDGYILAYSDTANRFVDTSPTAYIAMPAVASALSTSYVKYGQTVDLCAPPYSLSPGDDVTTALQAAIDATTDNVDIYLSKFGTYTLNGASRTGTAVGQAYAGQILLPAVPTTQSRCIRLRGSGPMAVGGSVRPSGSVVITSNATSGWIIDAIPSFTAYSAGKPWTNVWFRIEDLELRAPANPQCGGINAESLPSFSTRSLALTTVDANVTRTGALPGIANPQVFNAGRQLHQSSVVRGWNRAITLTEHGTFLDFQVTGCNTAFVVDGGDHYNEFAHVLVEQTQTLFERVNNTGNAPVRIRGSMETEAPSVTGLQFNKAPAGVKGIISGQLAIQMRSSAPGAWNINSDLGGSGFAPLVLTNLDYGTGRTDEHPRDDFRSAEIGAFTGRLTWPSLHTMFVTAGSAEIVGSVGTASASARSTFGTGLTSLVVPVSQGEFGGVSRSVEGRFTLAASSPHIQINADITAGGTSNGSCLLVDVTPSAFNLIKKINGTNTTLASGGAGVITAGTVANIALVVTHTLGLVTNVAAYVNGVKIVEAPVPLADAQVLASGTVWPFLRDGVGLVDATTTLDAFTVRGA